jgi:ribose transport system permease protein
MVADANQIRNFTLSGFLQKWLNRVGPILGLVLFISIFYVLTPGHYLSPFNLRVVLGQTVIVAIGAIGMTMIIVSGGIDLSVGSGIALTGVIIAVSLRAGITPAIAVASGILLGGLVGMINGSVITRLRVVPFIATLGMHVPNESRYGWGTNKWD